MAPRGRTPVLPPLGTVFFKKSKSAVLRLETVTGDDTLIVEISSQYCTEIAVDCTRATSVK